MNERAFKLDFYLALAAVLLSIVTTAALIYQTSVMRDQYAATVWPYLAVDSSFDNDGETFSLENDGFGPALIRSARLTVDGNVRPSWNSYLLTLLHDPKNRLRHGTHFKLSFSSVDSATIVRPGGTNVLFAFSAPGIRKAILAHAIALDFCYCSLNGACWTLHSTPGHISGSAPSPTAQCAIGETIGSPVQQFRI